MQDKTSKFPLFSIQIFSAKLVLSGMIGLIFLPLFAPAQISYSGQIVSKATKMGVPYATVGLIKLNSGTNANDSGYFQLHAAVNSEDTLIISSVGFVTAKIASRQVLPNVIIELEEKSNVLKEVVLIPLLGKTATLNSYKECGVNSYFSAGFVTQIAQLFEAPVPNSKLTAIHICKQGDQSTFRIRIYSRNPTTGAPGYDLSERVIEVQSSKRFVTVDVSKFNLLLSEADFFIAIEWIKIPQNERKIKSKLNNKAFNYVGYSPYLFFKNRTNVPDLLAKGAQVWQLTYKGTWIKFFSEEKSFLIAADLKY